MPPRPALSDLILEIVQTKSGENSQRKLPEKNIPGGNAGGENRDLKEEKNVGQWRGGQQQANKCQQGKKANLSSPGLPKERKQGQEQSGHTNISKRVVIIPPPKVSGHRIAKEIRS